MKLKTTRAHDNEYGDHYHKRVDTEYEVANERTANRLIRDGYAEEVADKSAAKAPAKQTEAK